MGEKRSQEGSLIQRIRERGLDLVVQLLEGIRALHNDAVLHCGLHSKNILFHEVASEITLRIADFGLATRLSDRRCHAVIPSRDRHLYSRLYPYLAPELLAGAT
jgi:serine/threonine protein kinase